MRHRLNALVDAQWLKINIESNDRLVVLHTSMMNPMTGELPVIGEQVIPMARHFDFETIFCDTKNDLPHTMPSAVEFEEQARELGINKDSIIVVYDDAGLYCSPRVWWMFRAMGHKQVYVLNGGFPAWNRFSDDCEKGFSRVSYTGDFCVRYDERLMINLEQVLSLLEEGAVVVDARSAGRFEGVEPEPRSGIRSGHIPKSKNIPFSDLIVDGYMKPLEALTKEFEQRHLDADNALVFSCGSGVTACILALAANQLGYSNVSVYDGSWSQWGSDQSLPVALGKSVDEL
jgi:thiosulfate/3-mercaptopyruvate sulfurtransferase